MLKAGRADTVVLASLDLIEHDPGAPAPYVWMLRAFEYEAPAGVETAAARAVRSFERLLRVYPGNPRLRHALGAAYLRLGDFIRARDEFKSSVAAGAAFWPVYKGLVDSYLSDKDIEDTAKFLAGRLAHRPDDPFLHQAVGVVQFYSSLYREAVVSLERARAVFRARDLKAEEAQCLLNIADVFTYLNDYTHARARVSEALRLARSLHDPLLEAQSLERSAFIWSDLGKGPQAFADCSRGLSLAQSEGARALEVVCSRTMGVLLLNRGDLAGAEERLGEAAGYYRAAQALRSQNICLYWLALVLRDRGDYAGAMSRAQEALLISRRTGFKTGEAFDLTAIGDIHLALGNHDRALEFNRQALAVAEKYIGKWSREECLNTIGSVHMELGNYRQALGSFEEALAYIEEIGHGREQARCLYNIGFAHIKLGELDAAARDFEASLEAAERSGNRIVAAFTENRLGDLYFRRGLLDKAGAAYGLAEKSGRAIGQPTVVWQAAAGFGALRAARGDIPGAIESYKRAVAVIEDVRVQLLLREYSSGYFQSKVSIYEALVNLLYEQARAVGDDRLFEECLFYAEKAKARSFLDDLQKARIEAKALPPAIAGELDVLAKSISRLSAELSAGPVDEATQKVLLAELEQAEDDYQLLIAKARAEDTNLGRALASEPCRVPEIRGRLLDARTGLLEYFAGDENLFVFLLSRDRLVVRRFLPAQRAETLRLAENFIRLVSSRGMDDNDLALPGERLFAALVGAAGPSVLSGLENLIVVPDGILNGLPFEALVSRPGGGGSSGRPHFLMEDCRITYAPSASTLVSVLARARIPGAKRDWIAVGDPLPGLSLPSARREAGQDLLFEYYRDKLFALKPLAYASREIAAIARLMSPEYRLTVTRGEATESRVKRLPLADFRILHFATHSLLDESAAGRSALVLTREPGPGEDGFLEAREIYEIRLDADLVVLSACQTAAGKLEKGEGIEGLARAFFCAGTQSVVASLWNVNDASTSRFMRIYYTFLVRGKSKAEALRLTKIAMSRSRGSRPFNWAPFVLIGEGEAGVGLHAEPWWRRIFHLATTNFPNSDSTRFPSAEAATIFQK